MNKLYGFTLDLDVFDTKINVLFGNKSRLLEWVAKKDKTLFKENPFFDGVTFTMWGKTYIFTVKKNDIGVVAHEFIHALYRELIPRNLPFNSENNEILAYSMGYCIGKYSEVIKKKNYFYLDSKDKWKSIKK